MAGGGLGLGLLGGLLGIGASKLMKPKVPPRTPVISANLAAEGARRDDALRRRRSAGANELTGGGAEARTLGGRTLLGM